MKQGKGQTLFLTVAEMKKRFPTHIKGLGPVSQPRPEWRNPVQFQIKYPKWMVCHGFCTTTSNGCKGWLEMGNYVLDLSRMKESEYFRTIVSNKNINKYTNLVETYRIPKKAFYKAHGISGVRRYDKNTMAMLVASKAPYHSYGPYLDE